MEVHRCSRISMLVNTHSWERALGQTLPWLPLHREWVQVLRYKIKLLHDWAPIDHFSSIFQHLLLPLPHTHSLSLPRSAHLSLFPTPTSSPHSSHLTHMPSLSPPLSCWPYSFSLEYAFSSACDAISLLSASQIPASSHFLWNFPYPL